MLAINCDITKALLKTTKPTCENRHSREFVGNHGVGVRVIWKQDGEMFEHKDIQFTQVSHLRGVFGLMFSSKFLSRFIDLCHCHCYCIKTNHLSQI